MRCPRKNPRCITNLVLEFAMINRNIAAFSWGCLTIANAIVQAFRDLCGELGNTNSFLTEYTKYAIILYFFYAKLAFDITVFIIPNLVNSGGGRISGQLLFPMRMFHCTIPNADAKQFDVASFWSYSTCIIISTILASIFWTYTVISKPTVY